MASIPHDRVATARWLQLKKRWQPGQPCVDLLATTAAIAGRRRTDCTYVAKLSTRHIVNRIWYMLQNAWVCQSRNKCVVLGIHYIPGKLYCDIAVKMTYCITCICVLVDMSCLAWGAHELSLMQFVSLTGETVTVGRLRTTFSLFFHSNNSCSCNVCMFVVFSILSVLSVLFVCLVR